MILSQENVAEFLQELDRRMQLDYGRLHHSHCLSNEEWLDAYEGESIDWIITEELYHTNQ